MDSYFKDLTTEAVNPFTKNLDQCSTEEMCRLLNKEDREVPRAVEKEIPQIARAVDLLAESLAAGGHMIYVGAGTSGRLGVLDASECPPTYGTSPELVQGYIAGGDIALRTAVEGSEDDQEAGARLLHEKGITSKDVVIGITASGSAPFVIGALEEARSLGCKTVGVVNNAQAKLRSCTDVCIAPVVGPEAVVGSTRMKSGTAQKLVLNMLTTCTMVKLGKVYGNLMVDLKASNRKLRDRAVRIVCQVAGTSGEESQRALDQADGSAKLAILMVKTGKTAQEARQVLEQEGGSLKRALETAGLAQKPHIHQPALGK